MSILTYTSPCKFNLYLDVISARPDGYHEVITILEPLYLCDTIELEARPGGIEVTCDHPTVPGGMENIVFRAASLLRETAEIRKGIRIRIIKRVPVAAGLGGGSANAAIVLQALNRLWKLNLPSSRLYRIARQLGSDVPFFLEPRTSLCKGRGEEVVPLGRPAPPFWVVLINPGFPLATSKMYSQIDCSRRADRPHPHINQMLTALKEGDRAAIASYLYNAFQEIVAAASPPVKGIIEFFRKKRVAGVVLAGSGPTVIGLLQTENEARELSDKAQRIFPPEYFIAAVSNRPPGEQPIFNNQ